MSHALACPIEGVERLTIATFGSTRPRAPVMCNRVSLMLKRQHDGQLVIIEAFEVPDTCTVRSPPVRVEIVHAMADKGEVAAHAQPAATFQERQVSVLIGWDTGSSRVNFENFPKPHSHGDTSGFDSTRCSTRQPKPFDRSLERAFVFPGEIALQRRPADAGLSSLWRLEAIRIQGTLENFGINFGKLSNSSYMWFVN